MKKVIFSICLIFNYFFNTAQIDDQTKLSNNEVIKVSYSVEENIKTLEKEIIELKGLTTSLSNKTDSNSKTQLAQKQKEVRENAIKTAENTQELMEITTDLVNNTLSTANLFANVANAMSILDTVEAVKIDQNCIKLEKRYNQISNVLSIGGALISSTLLILDKEDIKTPILTLSLSSLGSVIFKELSEKKELKNTLNYIHDKSTQISIHSFLLLRIKSVSNYMIELEQYNKQLIVNLKGQSAKIGFPKTDYSGATEQTTGIDGINVRNNWEDIKKLIDLVDDVLRLINQVDYLYSVELSTLQNEIKNRAGFKIYNETGRQSLENLVISSENARESWKNVRYFYTQIENSLTKFRNGSNDIYENAKPKVD